LEATACVFFWTSFCGPFFFGHLFVALLQGYTLGIPRGIRRGEGGFDQRVWPVNAAVRQAELQNCAKCIRKRTGYGKMPSLKAHMIGAQQNAEGHRLDGKVPWHMTACLLQGHRSCQSSDETATGHRSQKELARCAGIVKPI
jgi:hypothetical protein